MSQKIEGSLPSTMRPAVASVGSRISPAGAERSRPVEASAAGDSLRLTGEAAGLQVLQRELASAPAVDPARVQAVREALEAGTYKVDPDAIASRMLALDDQLGA